MDGMYRQVMSRLRVWKQSDQRKPLLLEGARQVGKTWTLREFGRQEYARVAYFNFEETPSLAGLFAGDIDIRRLLGQLQIETGTQITPGDTLIVFDDIQECPRALTALKYWHERANQYHVACAGSLLGVALHQQSSFPVGQVWFQPVRPLSFAEFLDAIGQSGLQAALEARDWASLRPFHERLVSHLRDYLFSGGMPEAVAAFAATSDYSQVRQIQLDILQAYDRDFSKHAPTEQVPRLRQVWQAVPAQLAKEQTRFAYSVLKPGARSRTHQTAIDWLTQAGVIVQVRRVGVPRLPLSAYFDPAFKLYLLDVGLLGALAGLSPATVVRGNQLFTEFSGALTEQYVAQELLAAFSSVPSYWTNGGGTAEVDFVVARGEQVIPIEAKATVNLKAQSLRIYREKYSPPLAIRASLHLFQRHDGLIDLPLYAVMTIPSLDADEA